MTNKTVQKHRVISFTYRISNEAGEVIEQSDLPVSYVHGVDQHVFEEVIQAMEGKKVGDMISVTLPANAFGDYDPSRVFSDRLENVPAEFQQIGAEATFHNEQGEQLTMRVVKIENDEIVLDGNHQYAGQSMTFHLKVMDIRDATEHEISSGLAMDYSMPEGSQLH